MLFLKKTKTLVFFKKRQNQVFFVDQGKQGEKGKDTSKRKGFKKGRKIS